MFDPFELAGASDPYSIYRKLRERAPVFHNPARGFWALSRFEDVRTASRDWATFSNAGGVDLDGLGREVFGPGDFLDMDPPEHDELRAVVKARFTPKAISGLAPLVTKHADDLLEGLPQDETFDAIDALAWALPTRVMCSLLGCPQDDHDEVSRLYRRVMRREPGDPEIPLEALDAGAEMRSYLLELARERRNRPGDDLMSEVALGRVRGSELPEPKIVGMCFVLFSAGIDTVASLIGNAVLLLGTAADQRRLVVREQDRLPSAIEEILRFESPLQFNARTTSQPTEIRGVEIPAGARVLMMYGAANRDERRFHEPDRLDFTREPKRHLAFGEGIHFCIGAPLARLQTRVALQGLLKRWPDYSIEGPIMRAPAYNMRTLAQLPVRTNTPSS